MKKQITSGVITLSLIFSPLLAYSATGVEDGKTVSGTRDNQPSVKDGADKSKSGNGFAQAVNMVTGGAQVVMGGVMIQQGFASTPATNWSLVAMGTMVLSMGLTNLAQGKDHGGAAGSAGVTGFQTDGFGGLTETGNTNDPYVNAATKDPNYKAIGSTLKTLEAQGVYNPKTGAFKIGDKTYKSSDFSSAGAMAAAGFPKGMIDGAMAANAEAERKALAKLEKVKIGASTAANGYEEGGGGGGGAPVGDGSGGMDDGSGAYAGAGGAGHGKTGLERDPSSLAGMSKNYNGEPIGVAADSIFLMMSRRYKVKESQESFFGPADLALQK
ncbi:hypothetical protein [Bdellovibrio svalbardensis]|uniref:Uncharacterized protein n=1 Tax=Bdellovibrio svalbardensis TaxID=2972972 RepID=A0ABT6DEY1_9BACT|nr:hypothetical protein [Bdellovibrio svalbardensis]MDG0815064.1 hypothetical protein [Bdellovibrio svalbardensis]